VLKHFGAADNRIVKIAFLSEKLKQARKQKQKLPGKQMHLPVKPVI
jgi:hypothetical protein